MFFYLIVSKSFSFRVNTQNRYIDVVDNENHQNYRNLASPKIIGELVENTPAKHKNLSKMLFYQVCVFVCVCV